MSHSASLRRYIFLYHMEHQMVQPTLLMGTFYIQRAFQRHLTRPNPSSNEEVMALTSWTKKTIATEKTLSRQSFLFQQRNSVTEKFFVAQRKLCRNRENSVTIKFSIATEKLCHDRKNSIATKFSIATKQTLSQ